MKNLFYTLIVLLGLTFQVVKAQEPKKADAKTQQKPKEGGPKLKKDGTPDMRYKENQLNAQQPKETKPVGPVKKDGTPDKRYKANKEAKK
jgi:hypothetical protein